MPTPICSRNWFAMAVCLLVASANTPTTASAMGIWPRWPPIRDSGTPPPPADAGTPPPLDAGTPPQPDSGTPPPQPDAGPPPQPDAGPPPQTGNPSNRTSPVGSNLDGIHDWSPDYAFVDAMKRSRPWISSTASTWEDGRGFTLDAQGWPTSLKQGQLGRTLLFWDMHRYPSGDYTVLYEGNGSLQYDVLGSVVASRTGRQVLRVDPAKGNFGLLITSIPNASDYLRNVRILLPGGVCQNDALRYCDASAPCASGGSCIPFEQNYATQIFHAKFLERIKAYSVLRFMDWMQTNESREQRWADRPQVSDVRWIDGVPLEIMVALVNRVSAHPWFNIPHAADDDYVRRFATYVRDNLRPELKVYVEYSNEVWNGQFPQATYAADQGRRLGLGQSTWDAQSRYYARRTTEIHKIWESVFQGQQQRVVRVLAAQAGNVGVAAGLLAYEDTAQHVDALAIAPYFGGEYGSPAELSRWQNATVDQLLSDVRSRSLPNSFAMVSTHAPIAQQYGLDLVAYEGGESFAGVAGTENNASLNNLFTAAGRDPRIKQIYLDYLAGWKQNGGQLFVHFTDCYAPGKWGRWGALEYMEQPRAEAPKFDGLQTFIEQNPRWW